MKKLNKRGFTIVELVVVIAVIAILAGVLIPSLSGIVTKANESKALQEVKNAWTLTLTEDLDPANTNEDVVNGKDVIVEYSTDIKIKVDKNGSASVYTGNESAGYKIENGKIVSSTSSSTTGGTKGSTETN